PGAARSAERALQLLEEPLVRAIGLLVLRLLELAEQATLLVAQAMRNDDVDEEAVVATPEALEDGHAPASQHADLSGLRSRLELELDVAVEGRNIDGRSERGLRHRQVDR